MRRAPAAKLRARIKLGGRYGLRALVLFLAGEHAANITGSDLTIDGGLITTL